jgi:polyferredoxin
MEARHERAHQRRQSRPSPWRRDWRVALCWSIFVALRLAQPVIDFVFWMHFIKPIYVIEPFEIVRAAILLIVTAGVGFIVGSVFALIWNALHKA